MRSVASVPGERFYEEDVDKEYNLEAFNIILFSIKKLNLATATHALKIEVQRVSQVTA
jgi:hypothetical protein